MKSLFLPLLLVAYAAAISKDYKTYKGYKVFSISPKDETQARLLRNWMLTNPSLDFWQEAKHGDPAHVMVDPAHIQVFMTQLRKHALDWSVHINDVGEQVAKFLTKENVRRLKSQKAFDINNFNTYDDTIDWVKTTIPAACATSGLTCTTATEGTTFEGRDIVSLTMSTGGSGKQTFLFNSLIHAREWIAGATVNKIIDHIATQYGTDATVTDLLDKYDFMVIPVLNPDGYVYSWDNERLWRKNRMTWDGVTCVGVDLNRNYDYNWCEEGASELPCSDAYCGTSGNSELETLTMDAIFSRLAASQGGNGVLGYLDVHAYGYMWMHPWGNTVNFAGNQCERADDHDDMYAVADLAADAIEDTHDDLQQWARGTSCEVIYATTGATDDYIKGVYGVKYPICPELRGNSFIIDASNIQPSFEEIWNGITTMIYAIEAQEGL